MIERDSKTGDFPDVVASTSRVVPGTLVSVSCSLISSWVSIVDGGDSPSSRYGCQTKTDDNQNVPLPTSEEHIFSVPIAYFEGLRPPKPYELRHSASSLYADEGIALEQIADLMGLASTRMIE